MGFIGTHSINTNLEFSVSAVKEIQLIIEMPTKLETAMLRKKWAVRHKGY